MPFSKRDFLKRKVDQIQKHIDAIQNKLDYLAEKYGDKKYLIQQSYLNTMYRYIKEIDCMNELLRDVI